MNIPDLITGLVVFGIPMILAFIYLIRKSDQAFLEYTQRRKGIKS